MNPALWSVVILYLAVVIGIGLWAAKRRVATYEDIAVAGRRVGPFLIGCSVAATWINGVTLITITGFGKSFGLSSYWHTGALCIGTVWAGVYLIPRMWKLQVITTPEIFERFFSPTHRLVALFVAMLRDFAATAGTIGATALVAATALNINMFQALVLTYVVTVIYVTLGGMWAVLVTDAIQFFIIAGGTVLLLIFAMIDAGGISGIVEKAGDPSLFSATGDFGILQISGWFGLSFFLACGYQSLAQRAYSARSLEAARRGFVYGGILVSLWYMVPALLGVTGVAMLGKEVEADQIFMNLTTHMASPYLQTLIFMSIVSANMSTLSSTIGTMGSNVTVDVYQRFVNPTANSKTMLRVSRLSIVVTAVLAAVVYYIFPLLLELFFAGGRLVAGSLSPALIAVLLFPRTRKMPRTILAALVLSAAAVVASQLLTPKELCEGASFFVWAYEPTLVGVVVSLTVILLGLAWEPE